MPLFHMVSNVVSNDFSIFKFKLFLIEIIFTAAFASLPFAIFTFAVHVSMPELRNFHGNCFVCCIFSAILVFATHPWVKLSNWNYVQPWLCKSMATILYFAVLSLCFWLNVMSLNFWLTFRYEVY